MVQLCAQWCAERSTTAKPLSARYVCVTSVHGVMTAQGDPEFAKVLNKADISTPDGMPIVWALRSFGCKSQQRVYGPTLMLEICRSATEHGRRIFLYGGHEESLRSLAEKLRARFPALQIVGAYAPPFRPLTAQEERRVQRQIRDSDADLVFVGMSTPKQEKWMYEHLLCFPGVTLVGVGAAFDFHSGRKRQAPEWMQRNGLEWLFRLASEPTRLWRRYLLLAPRFLPLWAKQKIRFQRSAPTGFDGGNPEHLRR